MKKTIQLLVVCATLGLLAMPVFANGRSQPANAVQDQCTDDNKAAWYAEFREKKNSDQPRAYEVAKKYVACPPVEAEAQIVTYLKTKFIEPYEKANAQLKRKNDLRDFVYNKKDYAQAFQLGPQVFADDPNDIDGYLALGFAGYAALSAGNKSFINDGLMYSKKAVDMIESGKTPADWKPTPNKADILARLNYWMASMKQDGSPAESLPYWMKAASSDTFKKDVQTYYRIGLAYENGAYQKQSEDYKKMIAATNNVETPETKLALENINQVVDRMIDAYARAVALAGSDPNAKVFKDDAMARLGDWYKFRHDKATDAERTTAVNELVAGILQKPLPPEPTPLTQLPTPPPTAAPPTGTTPPSGNGATAPGGNKNSPATPPKANNNPGRPHTPR